MRACSVSAATWWILRVISRNRLEEGHADDRNTQYRPCPVPREDAEFFAARDGKDVQFPPKLVSIQHGQMARARRLAQDRDESFDPAAYILMRSRVDPDLFDARMAAQALDFYGSRGLTSEVFSPD